MLEEYQPAAELSRITAFARTFTNRRFPEKSSDLEAEKQDSNFTLIFV